MNARTAAVLLLIVLAASAFYWLTSRPSGPPAYFDRSLTYAQALERSRGSGKPVFALVSADWCEPCHRFEAGALADARVAAWLTANTIPVFLDASDRTRPGAGPAADLRIMAFPTILLIRDGEPIARHEGVLDADRLLNWLETFSKEPPTPTG